MVHQCLWLILSAAGVVPMGCVGQSVSVVWATQSLPEEPEDATELHDALNRGDFAMLVAQLDRLKQRKA